MSFECTQEVANDYEKLLESDEECDVIIYAGENEKEEIHAHSFVLRALQIIPFATVKATHRETLRVRK